VGTVSNQRSGLLWRSLALSTAPQHRYPSIAADHFLALGSPPHVPPGCRGRHPIPLPTTYDSQMPKPLFLGRYPDPSAAIPIRRPQSLPVGRYPSPSAAIPPRRPLSRSVGRYPDPSAAIPPRRPLSRSVGRYPDPSATKRLERLYSPPGGSASPSGPIRSCVGCRGMPWRGWEPSQTNGRIALAQIAGSKPFSSLALRTAPLSLDCCSRSLSGSRQSPPCPARRSGETAHPSAEHLCLTNAQASVFGPQSISLLLAVCGRERSRKAPCWSGSYHFEWWE
jgi:hypothetical protein